MFSLIVVPLNIASAREAVVFEQNIFADWPRYFVIIEGRSSQRDSATVNCEFTKSAELCDDY